uniref:Uncharacterized protein n=1 Tax=viral metagenome TaxID=1070528 RepID=A0A6C0JY96_9ZZZZ
MKIFKILKQLLCIHRYGYPVYIGHHDRIHSEETCVKCGYIKVTYVK